ncbi:Hypothetical protein SMAX5B_012311 [Scophthalmus maximus]|uniref:Uncharacterized protein n=1 Tax=Scophthalmus maximus TaxID=52904 RepID=A0A2U9BD85_SCOMX|nr:Hypothetical protein SMAX5B_012311 [Scophthalmus maximus]
MEDDPNEPQRPMIPSGSKTEEKEEKTKKKRTREDEKEKDQTEVDTEANHIDADVVDEPLPGGTRSRVDN